jgi:predicted ribosome-associated RNA-binding protein Tma20
LLVSYSIAREIAEKLIPGADVMVTGILMVSPGWQLVDV